MRWERLFAELEAQSHDAELEERDALVEELQDGEWAGTSWLSLLGGHVVLDVRGHGRVEGQLVMANDHVVHVHDARVDHVVSAGAVLSVLSTGQRGEESSPVVAALGWGHVLRALRDTGEQVGVRLSDAALVDGVVAVVGQDFVQLRAESGRERLVPFGAIAVVSGRT